MAQTLHSMAVPFAQQGISTPVPENSLSLEQGIQLNGTGNFEGHNRDRTGTEQGLQSDHLDPQSAVPSRFGRGDPAPNRLALRRHPVLLLQWT
jgi:hypothetical protein